MSEPDGLEVALWFLAADLEELSDGADLDLEAAGATGRALDALESRATNLRREVEEMAAERGAPPPRIPEPSEPATRPTAAPRPATWDDVVARARISLNERQIDPATVNLDLLLDRTEVERIEQRHNGGFDVRGHLDPYDLTAALAAGVLGAMVDYLVVKIPSTTLWEGSIHTGSALTGALRDLAVDSDNWLAVLARVPFDRVIGTGIPGFIPQTHRVQTFGHDPLFGLGLGMIDIVRGTLTGIDPSGDVTVIASPGLQVANPALAFGLEVLHLLSDVGTRSGLPLPGWTALLTLKSGSFGDTDRTLAELSRWMFMRGYDSWHFLTMSTSVATVEATLRSYFALRQHHDEAYRADTEAEAARAGSDRISDHPRYQAMSLLAHGTAAAGNLGKLALAGGNPLTINYAQWLMLAKRLISALDRPRPADGTRAQAEYNRVVLDTGWSRVGFNPDLLPDG
ncbi:MAG: hypothetical protein P1T08_13245 [Acidimicrobiia bacterium]|nr:hypothetical protein [Acidimicrobiia bacterium]